MWLAAGCYNRRSMCTSAAAWPAGPAASVVSWACRISGQLSGPAAAVASWACRIRDSKTQGAQPEPPSVQQGTGPALKYQTMYSNIKLPKDLARRGTGMQLFSRV
jgi:hypothetical protein